MPRSPFSARSAGGGLVEIRLADEFAARLQPEVADLLRALRDTRPRGALRRRPVLANERLFPDAYADKTQSAAFRRRHGDAMRARLIDATRRVLAQCAPVDRLVLDEQALRDWFIVLAHARTRHHRGSRRQVRLAAWLRAIQEHIALAAEGTQCPTCSPTDPDV